MTSYPKAVRYCPCCDKYVRMKDTHRRMYYPYDRFCNECGTKVEANYNRFGFTCKDLKDGGKKVMGKRRVKVDCRRTEDGVRMRGVRVRDGQKVHQSHKKEEC